MLGFTVFLFIIALSFSSANITCFGTNDYGQAINYSGSDAKSVGTGGSYTCFLKSNGNVDCEGSNILGEATDYLAGDAVGLAVGLTHTCILKSNRNVQCLGYNNGEVISYNGGDVANLSAGNFMTLLLLQNGNVKCYGQDFTGFGRCQNYSGEDAVQVAAGIEHMCIRKSNGNVICYGYNELGQANNYSKGDARGVSLGAYHTCILKSNGNVECQGCYDTACTYMDYGFMQNYSGGDAVAISSRYNYNCILKSNGNVICRGYGYPAQYPGANAIGLSAGPDSSSFGRLCMLTSGAAASDQVPSAVSLAHNSTLAGAPVRLTASMSDDVGLAAYRVAIDNCTGTFVNRSWVSLGNLPSYYLNYDTSINSTGNCLFRWRVYVNDSAGKTVESSIDSFSTTPGDSSPIISSLSHDLTTAGSPVRLTAQLSDDLGLSAYRISYDNCLGQFQNDSWVSLVGTSYPVSVQKQLNSTIGCTVRWKLYVSDSSSHMVESSVDSFNTTGFGTYYIDSCTASNFAYSGIYYLTQDIRPVGTVCLSIVDADSVVLDCHGHSILTPGTQAIGVYVGSSSNITIRNCVVEDFTYGIRSEASNVSLVNNTLNGSANNGVWINSGSVNFTSNRICTTADGLDVFMEQGSVAVDKGSNTCSLTNIGLNCSSCGSYSLPRAENLSVSSTLAGSSVLFGAQLADDKGLAGYLIAIDNCTGSYVNDSWLPVQGKSYSLSVSKAIPSLVGCTVRFKVYVNDTSGQLVESSVNSFSTTAGDSSPQISGMQSTSTVAGSQSILSATLMDDLGLSSFRVFIDNCQGSLVPGDWQSISGPFFVVSVPVQLSVQEGCLFAWQVEARDTSNHITTSSMGNFLIESVPVTETCGNPPAISDMSVSSTLVDSDSMFRATLSDDHALSGYVFELDYGTGVMEPGPWYSVGEMKNYQISIPVHLPPIAGTRIKWALNVNDSCNQWSYSSIREFTTSGSNFVVTDNTTDNPLVDNTPQLVLKLYKDCTEATVHVTDSNGKAVQNVLVELVFMDTSMRTVVSGLTDGFGRFSFPSYGLYGSYKISVSKPGYSYRELKDFFNCKEIDEVKEPDVPYSGPQQCSAGQTRCADGVCRSVCCDLNGVCDFWESCGQCSDCMRSERCCSWVGSVCSSDSDCCEGLCNNGKCTQCSFFTGVPILSQDDARSARKNNDFLCEQCSFAKCTSTADCCKGYCNKGSCTEEMLVVSQIDSQEVFDPGLYYLAGAIMLSLVAAYLSVNTFYSYVLSGILLVVPILLQLVLGGSMGFWLAALVLGGVIFYRIKVGG